jgi:hypothetical protein
MWQLVVDTIRNWTRQAREIYAVDPVIFIVLLTACAPLFYFSIFRLIRAVAKKKTKDLPVWGTIFLASTAIPYLYVLIFGRNMPWWIYIILGLLLAQGAYSLVKRLRAKPKGGAAADTEDKEK